MTQPLLSVVIPTIGRPSLAAALASVRSQAPADECEIVVVHDTVKDEHCPPIREIAAAYQARYLMCHDDSSVVGHYQRTVGQRYARGQWIAYLGDDDAWFPEMWWWWDYAYFREPAPLLWQALTRVGLVWHGDERLILGNIDANCLVVPNDPARLPAWPHYYCGDFTMIQQTITAYNGACHWIDFPLAYTQDLPDATWAAAGLERPCL